MRPARFLLASFLFAPLVEADVLYVPGDFPDVQTAIDNASSGDTIVIQGGTWGPLVIDKPLQLVGDPLPLIQGEWDSVMITTFHPPITLAGPGSGAVVLARLEVGGLVNGACCGSAASPGITGGGFSELRVYDSSVQGPEWIAITGLAFGEPAIDTSVPFVLIERSTVRGSRTVVDSCVLNGFDGPPGLVTQGTVLVLDSTVHGGTTGPYCYQGPDCPDPCPGGRGGIGIICDVLYRSGSTIQGGAGAMWTTFFGAFCCQFEDGEPLQVNADLPLANDLHGSGEMQLGMPYTLSWTSTGPIGFLFFSPGAAPPTRLAPSGAKKSAALLCRPNPGCSTLFLDPARLTLFDVVSSPGGITVNLPVSSALIGMSGAFQLYDPEAGLTRPVSGVFVP